MQQQQPGQMASQLLFVMCRDSLRSMQGLGVLFSVLLVGVCGGFWGWDFQHSNCCGFHPSKGAGCRPCKEQALAGLLFLSGRGYNGGRCTALGIQ
jgi:hypothetical protein